MITYKELAIGAVEDAAYIVAHGAIVTVEFVEATQVNLRGERR